MAGFHPSCEASLAPWEMIYRGRFSEVLKRHFHNTNKMRTDCGTTGDAWLGVCEANTGRSNKMTKTHHSLSISMTNVLMRSISRCISKTVPHTPNEEIFKRRKKHLIILLDPHCTYATPKSSKKITYVYDFSSRSRRFPDAMQRHKSTQQCKQGFHMLHLLCIECHECVNA